MKTILYNPIFINPQAYYVFPRLTRWLHPDNGYKEPANYIGQIEVTIIAYGEIGYTEYFEHTNYIDFTNFSNSYVRISLFTRLGSCVLGEWKIGAMESDRPYIEPEVLASLKAVVIVGDKTNQDKDRDTVANLVDASNPFIISNAAFKLNSGFGKYEITFQYFPYTENITTVSDSKVVFGIGGQLLIPYPAMTENIPSFKIKVSGLSGTYHFRYYYRSSDGVQHSIDMAQDGYYELPICYNVQSSSDGTNCGFANNGNDVVTITQIPSFEGAFVTDGVDDLITSTKTVQEMLGESNEITVVSMIHQVKDSANNVSFTNYIRGSANGYFRNIVNNYDKTGIYGYTSSDLMGLSVVNNILGDKNDYTSNGDNRDSIINGNFSVQGYSYNDGNNTGDFSSVAWYWTVIANKVLTTDQINQVIAYFNLDRTLKPDILCDVKKQGITNENHAEFGDKLIDFSGNGRDIQLNNLAWKGGSGIAAKQYETFKDWTNTPYQTSTVTEIDEFTRVVDSTSNAYWVSMINRTSDFDKVHDSINIVLYQDDMLLVHECKYKIAENVTTKALYETLKSGVNTITLATIDKFTDIPEDAEIMSLGEWVNPKSNKGSVKITLLPSYKGGLLLDGGDDFGKATGMPVYKDYTFIIDYERISYASSERWVAGVVSKSHVANQGAFILMTANTTVEPGKQAYSFGGVTSFNRDDFTRALVYQSKYKCGDVDLTVGEGVDSDTLWLGTFRDNDQRFFNGAIYSLMSFPYSMSEFLIERQLKKHKLGTLYPNMVEFRPVIKSNASYDNIVFYYKNEKVENGTYLTVGSSIGMHIRLSSSPVNEIKSITVNGIPATFKYHDANNNIYQYDFNLTSKSPQKINITIDEYIRFEDIVQPYPVLLRFKDENGNEVSWGGKFRVGSTITRIGSAADSNLLPNIYNIFGLLLNDNQVTSSKVIVEKTMVFKAKSAYIFDNNEPKCILSPSRLRIPNSSYKLLGYIPDISGHGNHGNINNSAYAGMSGVNGYPVVFGANKTWANESNGYVTSITSNTIHITNVLNAGLALLYSYVKYNGNLQNIKEIPPFKIEIKGLEGRSKFIYKYLATSDATKETNLYLGNGTHELPKSFLPTEALINNAVVGFSISPIEEGVTNFLSDITIKVLPEYEGAYCLDGVDDFVTIPTVTGGKQVLMKVNWDSSNSALLYGQRGYNNEFAIYNGSADSDDNPIPAYQGRNNGQTYIDGILNSNIKASELRAITHNITITNELSAGVNKFSPVIGSNRVHNAYFTNMALYDFMLFDNISTDDKIKQLNEYVGIEGNTEWRKTK